MLLPFVLVTAYFSGRFMGHGAYVDTPSHGVHIDISSDPKDGRHRCAAETKANEFAPVVKTGTPDGTVCVVGFGTGKTAWIVRDVTVNKQDEQYAIYKNGYTCYSYNRLIKWRPLFRGISQRETPLSKVCLCRTSWDDECNLKPLPNDTKAYETPEPRIHGPYCASGWTDLDNQAHGSGKSVKGDVCFTAGGIPGYPLAGAKYRVSTPQFKRYAQRANNFTCYYIDQLKYWHPKVSYPHSAPLDFKGGTVCFCRSTVRHNQCNGLQIPKDITDYIMAEPQPQIVTKPKPPTPTTKPTTPKPFPIITKKPDHSLADLIARIFDGILKRINEKGNAGNGTAGGRPTNVKQMCGNNGNGDQSADCLVSN